METVSRIALIVSLLFSGISETEPNDTMFNANSLEIGQWVSGTVKGVDEDWFVLSLPPGNYTVYSRSANVELCSFWFVLVLDCGSKTVRFENPDWAWGVYVRVTGNGHYRIAVEVDQ